MTGVPSGQGYCKSRPGILVRGSVSEQQTDFESIERCFPFPLTSDIAIITEMIAIQSMVKDECCDIILLFSKYNDRIQQILGLVQMVYYADT